jgi:hypothetical protein
MWQQPVASMSQVRILPGVSAVRRGSERFVVVVGVVGESANPNIAPSLR